MLPHVTTSMSSLCQSLKSEGNGDQNYDKYSNKNTLHDVNKATKFYVSHKISVRPSHNSVVLKQLSR